MEFLLVQEEYVAHFLGIKITRPSDKDTITLTQTGLTDRILRSIVMEQCLIKYTPEDKDPTHKDLEGARCCEEWD